MPSLSRGIDQKEPEDVGLQSVHSGQGIMSQSTEEALIQVHPKRLQASKVRAVHTQDDVIHYAIHLKQKKVGVNLRLQASK